MHAFFPIMCWKNSSPLREEGALSMDKIHLINAPVPGKLSKQQKQHLHGTTAQYRAKYTLAKHHFFLDLCSHFLAQRQKLHFCRQYYNYTSTIIIITHQQ